MSQSICCRGSSHMTRWSGCARLCPSLCVHAARTGALQRHNKHTTPPEHQKQSPTNSHSRHVSAQTHTITLACTHSRENHSLTTAGWRVYHQAVCAFISTCVHKHRYLRAFCSLGSVIFILYCAKFTLPLFSNNNQYLFPVSERHRNEKSSLFTLLSMC